MQCGVACLQMVCKYYGKEYSLDTLSRYCFATTEGVTLLGISQAATNLGLHVVCGRINLEMLSNISLPCILHWNQNHFVVLYQIKKQKGGKRKYYVADPGKGLLDIEEKEFINNWVSTINNEEE